jgi:HAMP domain-containing protein
MKLKVVFRFILGVLIILAVSLGVFYLVMSPPLEELGLMALFLAITALVSSMAGYLAYSLVLIALKPRLRWGLMGIYVLSSVLTFFNVWYSAKQMFLNSHDLLLAIVLLVFAGGMATALGYFLSSTLIDRIDLLKQAAGKLAKGNLATRVSITGRDEIAALAQTFNQMASQLQAMDEKQRELEQCAPT